MKNFRWRLYKFLSEKIMLWGLKKGYVWPYSADDIEKFRDVYYGGAPASVILLCNAITNGNCYDRALLASRAFMGEPGDVKLIYASVADLRLNPEVKEADHCFVERITGDGEHIVYDTSTGFVYSKWFYWLLNRPKIRKINDKQAIKDFLMGDEPEHPESSKFILAAVVPCIEATYGQSSELYSAPGIELLQREVELFKKKVLCA